MMDIKDLLVYTEKNNASDLHLSATNPPVLRINGDMTPYGNEPLSAEDVRNMLHSIMTPEQKKEYEETNDIDFAIDFGGNMRFRVNAFSTLNGPAAVMRTIPTKVLSLDDLRAPPVFRKLAELHKGLVLVTGPTGSGKSTTLAAMIDYINSHHKKHIITVEDPVEFVHVSKQSLINQREVGKHTASFARALKSALREDPDIILVGEMRDRETIQLALTAAETGHLVMGTLHTSSAPKTIDRIIDVFPGDDKEMVRAMLSVSIEGIISQTLIKRKGGGRVAAHEIMLGSPAIRNLIREAKIPQLYSLIQMGAKHGMITMKDSVHNLLTQDIITAEAAHAALNVSTSEEESSDDSKQASGGSTVNPGARPMAKPGGKTGF